MIVLTPSLTGIVSHKLGYVGVQHCSNVVYARHCCLALGMREAPGRDQLWVDDDVLVTPEHVNELRRVRREASADVVVGWYPRKSRAPGDDPQPTNEPDLAGELFPSWCDVSRCAMGCALVSWSVWERLNVYRTVTPFGECPAAFSTYVLPSRVELTEDYAFSCRCRDVGVRIVGAARVCPSHGGEQFGLSGLAATLQSLYAQE